MNTTIMEDRILTVPQVAAYLSLSKSKIYYLISRKELPHLRLGKNVRVRDSDLKNWLNQQIDGSTGPARPLLKTSSSFIGYSSKICSWDKIAASTFEQKLMVAIVRILV